MLACAETNQLWIDEIEQAFGESHPHQVKLPQDNMYGMSLWSKLELENVEVEVRGAGRRAEHSLRRWCCGAGTG